MKRHVRRNYHIIGEGIHQMADGQPVCRRPSSLAELRKFRFSRLGPQGGQTTEAVRRKVAEAMTARGARTAPELRIPAGYTYLGQFVDHDLTMDATARSLGEHVTIDELVQGRSPALDLDSLYGRGPHHPEDRKYYAPDRVHLRTGRTTGVDFPSGDPVTAVDHDGHDLPRVGEGSGKAERRAAQIPDPRNDENLAVAQTHLAFIRFHNRVVDDLVRRGAGAVAFETARETVVKHYQWMLRTDFLPRLCDPAVVDDVFQYGRRFFEVPEGGDSPYAHVRPGDAPTMPIEFSVACYRLGHSMVRGRYEWNRVFHSGHVPATMDLLFNFCATSGTLSPGADPDDPESGDFERLPTNWIADFRRLYDFAEAGRADLVVPDGQRNIAERIDTRMVDPLADLPLGSFGARGQQPAPQPIERNLAYRNLTRGDMVKLASGQQMAEFLKIDPLTAEQIVAGDGGAVLDALDRDERDALVSATPLWFYVLREAELNGGRLAGVGARVTAEVFHRAMEGSRHSILRDAAWRPELGPDRNTFRMVDLLLHACDGRAEVLNPLGK